jgi:hypothetical protein
MEVRKRFEAFGRNHKNMVKQVPGSNRESAGGSQND